MIKAGERWTALDALRGLAVAGMILVVSPGDWGQAYGQLQHAAWNGATVADMVFPTFLFSVGAALGLSFPRDLSTLENRRRYWSRLGRRTLALVLLGLFVEATYVWAIAAGAPYPGGPGLSHLRIPGILQRIGLCYGLAGAVLAMTAGRADDGRAILAPWRIAGVIAIILVGYTLLLEVVPVPGFGAGHLTPDGSLPAYIDRTLFTEPHLWPLGSASGARPATYDPEGLLTTLPATANVLLGALAAWAWRRWRSPWRTTGVAVMLIVAAVALDPLLPINKRIWTGSFALVSGGVSALTLLALEGLLRWRPARIALAPLRVLGGNAILAFLISTIFSRLSGFALLVADGARITPQAWGYHHALTIVPDLGVASLLCAIGVLTAVTVILWPLHVRAIHFRI